MNIFENLLVLINLSLFIILIMLLLKPKKIIKDGFNKVGPAFTSKFGHMNFKNLIKGL